MQNSDISRIFTSAAVAAGILAGSPMLSYAADASKKPPVPEVVQPLIKKDEALLQKVYDTKNKKKVIEVSSAIESKSATPKFRTNEELALYKLNQQLPQLKTKLDTAIRREASAKKAAATTKSTLASISKSLDSVNAAVERGGAVKAGSELLDQQTKLRREEKDEKANLRSIQKTIASEENEVRSIRLSITKTEDTIKEKENAVRIKLAELAVADKKELERKEKKLLEAQYKSLLSKQIKANDGVKVAGVNLKKSIDSLKNGVASERRAKDDLKNTITQKATLEAKVESLQKEIKATMAAVEDSTKLITERQQKILMTETEVKKLETAKKVAEEALSKANSIYSDAQNSAEAAKKQIPKN